MVVLRFHDAGISQHVLAGAALGRRAAEALAGKVPAVSRTDPVVVAFDGIDVATASFLRECLLGLKHRGFTVVVRNASAQIEDELNEMLNAHGESMIACGRGEDGSLHAQVLGTLDAGQRRVLEAADSQNEVTAQLLDQLYPEEHIGITAWNNRLAGLSARGLLTERRRGRQKVYTALARSICNGP